MIVTEARSPTNPDERHAPPGGRRARQVHTWPTLMVWQGPAAEHPPVDKDLEAIQKRALAEGLPYQTLIASLLHKYATGRLKEI